MSVLNSIRLTLPADVDGTGQVDGVFDLSTNVRFSPGAQMAKLIGQRGQLLDTAIDFVASNSDPRGGYSLDAGTGAYIAEIDFQSFEGSSGRWGDGSAADARDAEGDSAFRQMSVFVRYLNQGKFDSRNPATLAWGEYHSGGEYSAVDVTVSERATLSVDVNEETSTFSGTLQLVGVQSITDTVPSQEQDAR
jgi:hypothetical protein